MSDGRGKLVYSTAGPVCPRCGGAPCRCRPAAPVAPPAPAPPRGGAPVVKLRLEKQGRGGKSVTVIDGLTHDAARVAALARELKAALGTGGTALDGAIELQGDRRDKLRELLAERGFRVKG